MNNEKMTSEKKGGFKSFLKSRKTRMGAGAVIVTVLVIVGVILLNLVLAAITSNHPLYLDVTENSSFRLQEQTGELTVVISVDGQEVERCPLAELSDNDSVYSHNGYTLKVGMSYPIYPDKPCIRVVESDCPTQDCVHTGEIYRAGQSIVCLPARIIIALEGTPVSGDGPDLVIG